MTNHLIVLLLLALFLTSCGTTPAVPTQPIAATLTPSIASSPTPSASAKSTPYPPLRTQGPHLLFTRDNKNLILMDADGIGRKHIQLPNNGYTTIHNAVSPDGKWIVYFSGSIDEPYDIVLNILNLSEETTQSISRLLDPNFPENLDPIVETMVLGDPPVYDSDCFEDMECRRSLVQRELTGSIYFLDWSPDSQAIAFTAQIDGPSSDIYIYTLQKKTIRQLTSEPENIYWLDWAPNGKSILYEICSTPGTGYEGRTLHITDLQGSSILINDEHLYRLRWGEYDWLTGNIYLLDHPNDTDKPPVYDLMTVDTGTGQFKQIWPYSLEYFVINKENETIVLAHRNHQTQRTTVPEGIYIVHPNGEYQKISDRGTQFILKQGQGPYPVFGEDYEGRVYNIRSDGSVEKLEWGDRGIPWISPDGTLLLFRENGTFALYNSSNELLKSWPMEDGIYTVTWNADSSGVFVFTDVNVYFLAISGEQLQPLLENCSPKKCEYTRFVWLP